jgi:hypothetical protein
VKFAGIGPDQDVLDVGTGTGVVAIRFLGMPQEGVRRPFRDGVDASLLLLPPLCPVLLHPIRNGLFRRCGHLTPATSNRRWCPSRTKRRTLCSLAQLGKLPVNGRRFRRNFKQTLFRANERPPPHLIISLRQSVLQ